MNQINQIQNMPKQINRLAAQRQLYSEAKNILFVQMVLGGPVAVATAFIGIFCDDYQAYVAAWGLLVAILDALILSRWLKHKKDQAARVQELFDCDVLQLEWSNLKAGRKPDAEEIVETSSKFKCKDPSCDGLSNWYPVAVEKLPLYMARILCQRANCWWDSKLRRRYAIFLVVALGIVSIGVFFTSLYGGLTLQKFILVVVSPLIPAFTIGFRQFNEHLEAATRLDGLREFLGELWDGTISGSIEIENATFKSRVLQDEIFNHRLNSPLIFDWIYKRLRNSDEENMNVGTAELIEEALAASPDLQ